VKMGENKPISPKFDLDAKYDACLDLSLRRSVYGAAAGALGGLLLFRSPVTRWAAVAFGAGLGIGSAYTDCSHIYAGRLEPRTTPPPPKIPDSPVYPDGQD